MLYRCLQRTALHQDPLDFRGTGSRVVSLGISPPPDVLRVNKNAPSCFHPVIIYLYSAGANSASTSLRTLRIIYGVQTLKPT